MWILTNNRGNIFINIKIIYIDLIFIINNIYNISVNIILNIYCIILTSLFNFN